MEHAAYNAHSATIAANKGDSTLRLPALKSAILADIDNATPGAKQLSDDITMARTLNELMKCLEEANYIQFRDRGHGMSARDLADVYLTIGTPHRRLQRTRKSNANTPSGQGKQAERPILGEKGLGRLSAMRLGWRLEVTTTTKGDAFWNHLSIDWRHFTDDSLMVNDIPLSPTVGHQKSDPTECGTLIRIYALTSAWPSSKLSSIAATEFSELTDPFVPKARYPISLRYNNTPVAIPHFNEVLFQYAHASATANYIGDADAPRFVGTVRYNLYGRENTFHLDKSALASIVQPSSPAALASLGPFSVSLYWFNRRILKAIEGIGDQRAVRALVNDWSGGLKLYRDGFRVNPYGDHDDDWLDIDKGAFASSGYKVNRHQIIGVVTISSQDNLALVDQTNREGLRDCPEKDLLIGLLRHLIITELRNFLDASDREVDSKIPTTFEELEDRVDREEQSMQDTLRLLITRHPEVGNDATILEPLRESVRIIRSLLDEATRLAQSYEAGHSELTNLAGLGLMVEIVAHELNRATSHALRTLTQMRSSRLQNDASESLNTLRAQLETLRRRLQILDPMSTAGRQRKETFDLAAWTKQILDAHSAQFARHGVDLEFSVVPPPGPAGVRVHMVKGMLVQILENLISNSIYWLKVQTTLNPEFKPKIQVNLNSATTVLTFSDNGPGVPRERATQVFQPFYTTKPARGRAWLGPIRGEGDSAIQRSKPSSRK